MKKGEKAFSVAAVAGKLKINVGVMLALQIISSGFGVAFALFLRGAVNRATCGDEKGFWFYVVFLAAAAAIILACNALCRRFAELTESELENRLKLRLFGSLLFSDCEYVSSRHSGGWMNLLTKDTETVAKGFTEIIPNAAGAAVRLVGAFAMIAVIAPRLFVVLAPVAALLIILSALFKKTVKAMYREEREADGAVRVYMQERLIGMPIVREYCAENEAVCGAKDVAEAHRRARLKRNRFANFCAFGFGVVMYGGYICCVAVCGAGMLSQSLDLGAFVALLQLIALAQTPVAGITGYFSRYYEMSASVRRFAEAEGVPAPEKDIPAERLKDMEEFGLDNVSFGYAGGDSLALDKVSLKIKRGERVAITGESGCGKSTALKLMIGLYRAGCGEAYVKCGGESLPAESFRRLFAYVPQGNCLICGSVREIVSLAYPSACGDDERIWEALRIACADGFVSDAGGLDVRLGERGAGLSEGQAQRLAVARAVFSDRDVFILDECTSALDPATERELLSNIFAMKGKTAVVVTHRKAAADLCDRTVTFT